MKRIFQVILLTSMILLFFKNITAQELSLENLKTPNSPGFQILDISPSSIERPTNPKAFALSMFNLTSNGTAIPKNFAFELSPYWYTKPSNASVFKYLNINDGKHHNMFTGIFNKLSVSMVSAYSDSTSGSLLKNNNYIALGARTNLITVRSKKQNSDLKEALTIISERISNLKDNTDEKDKLKGLFTRYSLLLRSEKNIDSIIMLKTKMNLITIEIDKLNKIGPNELEKKLDSDEVTVEQLKKLSAIPLFQLDAAYAYSEAIPGNVFANKRFNRSGFWVNMTLSGFSFSETKLENNIAITASARFLNDNILTDTLNNIFQRKNSVDIGGRLEYSIQAFSLSVEYLKRKYSGNSSLNTERTVGMLQYKINDKLYLTGTYGKNFGKFNNLFTTMGINWGFGKSAMGFGNSD